MSGAGMDSILFHKFTLREALYLGFCATFIVITRAVLRLHLNVPGHAMFFTMFFLILGKGCVRKMWAATLIGLIAGLLSASLGMGKGGPLIIVKFVLPALIVDAAGGFYPEFPYSLAASVVIGAAAAFSRAITLLIVDWVVGMDRSVVFGHILVASTMNTLFGALGAGMVPSVARRLKRSGLVF